MFLLFGEERKTKSRKTGQGLHTSSQDGITGSKLTPLLNNQRNQSKYMKQRSQDIAYQKIKDNDPREMENKQDEPCDCPSVLLQREFLGCSKGGRSCGRAQQTGVAEMNLRSRESKTEFTGQSTRKKNPPRREDLGGSAEGAPLYILLSTDKCMHMRKQARLDNKPYEKIKVKIAQLSPRDRNSAYSHQTD